MKKYKCFNCHDTIFGEYKILNWGKLRAKNEQKKKVCAGCQLLLEAKTEKIYSYLKFL